LIIDAGCGVGVLSDLIAGKAKSIVGVDPSSASINIAKEHFGAEVRFVTSTLESYARRTVPQASVIIANMVLMDVLDLNSFLNAAFALLRPNGSLIFSVTHPFFWPEYYGYASQKWFRYDHEAIVESPFRISSQPDCRLNSTHVHRPLSSYIEALFEAGFVVELLREPVPSPQISKMYPKPWKVPRYMVGLARRDSSKDFSRSRRRSAGNRMSG
jgi:2-polyprenyl-3-methyl-5-hydroxy-6-metoxy-1,4-benzoquinol methylase